MVFSDPYVRSVGYCQHCASNSQSIRNDPESRNLRENFKIRHFADPCCEAAAPDTIRLPGCCHLRLPKLKALPSSCWDQDHYIPIEALQCYIEHGYLKAPPACECLPLDAKKCDKCIRWYETEADKRAFGLPYFKDPTNPHRWFKSGYGGHVPMEMFRTGETHCVATAKALNRFTVNHMTPHLKDSCGVYIDPGQYCDNDQKFDCRCDKDRTFDGHFHDPVVREIIRKKRFCQRVPCCNPSDSCNDPLPFCITDKPKPNRFRTYCNSTFGST